jgi:7,8-dihydropterin-6-yl-methyl-4-(beta-D-ribofuranosyl)aminobenzene 5'-phosphate synthase
MNINRLTAILLLLPILSGGCIQQRPSPGPQNVTQTREEPGTSELIIIYDNNPFDSRLETAWGFSCLVRLPEKTILFDTGGDSEILLGNMERLQIDPKEVDAVVLSHIHGDHTGGLGGFLKENNNVTVYLPASFPQSFKNDVRSFNAGVVEIHEFKQLLPGVYTTGELGTSIKEQAMILTTEQGLVVVTGCSHPGVQNMVRVAKTVLPGNSIYLVIGGWHLGGASTAELKTILDDFNQMGVEKVAPCHCSGSETRRLFEQSYGNNYIESGVGQRIPLPAIKY